ncbi:Ribonucleases P/MRP protein subunit pop1 [Saxophila tyrrhenica]|uniref:Ribonucleases P/MRP protein subunit pop1 n=1 Tax=Saxophila tyrrhenica TaxID=1690608 RepID=A0AAV9PQE4_9PEZI|nr:Ribonucleases P/MRP protein subunit pop1 [Saxophila tyrrhenica]
MAQQPASAQQSKKRKAPPPNTQNKPTPNKRQKPNQPQHFRQKQRDARTLSTQTTSAAFSNGALDVDKFVQARQYEIRALEQGMQRSKKALNRRAFQQVPRDLRRRTAAHDAKRVPKRLRPRAVREMLEDNTPGPGGVAKKKTKVTRHMRLRLETVKKLRALGTKKKAEKDKEVSGKTDGVVQGGAAASITAEGMTKQAKADQPRKARVKKAPTLAQPPPPKAKFRKRQKHKSWLPTHPFHAKRAHMTPPSAPLWRFAVPLTPTQKSYRPTHRAGRDRGAVAWDVSYLATIGLTGEQRNLEGLLRTLGVGVSSKGDDEDSVWGAKGEKWRRGTRVLESRLFEREAPHRIIAPATIIWCGPEVTTSDSDVHDGKSKRMLFIRVHPSAFFQVWEEAVRLSKVAKPYITVDDLRFDVGSIEVTGPGATEALVGALSPYPNNDHSEIEQTQVQAGKLLTNLAGLTTSSSLPPGALLAFDVLDPRLRHPPRTVSGPQTQDDQNKLIELLASWPLDAHPKPPGVFDSQARARGAKLPSQKAINRRKALAPPGSFPAPIATDPKIPVLLHPSTDGGWTLLAPWKTIQPIWCSLLYYPLSTGGQPRFGGLREQQQLAFEAGRPWFPADFPGTEAGWAWEVSERTRRWQEWSKRPKGKRISWEKVESNFDGKGGKGEVGRGWDCDWEVLLAPSQGLANDATADGPGEAAKAAETAGADASTDVTKPNTKDKVPKPTAPEPPSAVPKPAMISQLTAAQAQDVLRSSAILSPPHSTLEGKLAAVRLTLLTRGVPQACARIYRLPSITSDPDLRKAWLALQPAIVKQSKQTRKHAPPPRLSKDAPAHEIQRRLAQELLKAPAQAGEDPYPACPSEKDLIGFVTTGNFNLAEGQGTGIGSLLLSKVVDRGVHGKESRLCVVRNAGEGVARLARWELV